MRDPSQPTRLLSVLIIGLDISAFCKANGIQLAVKINALDCCAYRCLDDSRLRDQLPIT